MNRAEEAAQARLIARCQREIGRYPALQFLFHVPNGGQRGAMVGAQMKALGVKRGVPDLLLPLVMAPRRGSMTRFGIAIEMKASAGRLSPEQVAWFDHLTEQGWLCYVRRNEEEAFDTLVSYIEGHPHKDAHEPHGVSTQ